MLKERSQAIGLGLVALACVLLFAAFHQGLLELGKIWSNREEYSHGWLIPLISAFLLWQDRDRILASAPGPRWPGVVMVAASLVLFVLGDLATLYVVVHYAFVGCLWGLFVAWLGVGRLRYGWAPLLLLAFMVPLPPFLYNRLSGFLQLISSALGVEFIRLCGISVFLEGNVIDLGSYQLQVVEACNGLRYLFPLMSFGFVCAYLFQAPLWQRLLVFLSTGPITVLMNSFRIGVIGVLVEHWGTAMAEGFLHDFEGWVIFMACVAILFLEMLVLTRLTRRGVALRDVFWPHRPAVDTDGARLFPERSGVIVTTVVLLGAAASAAAAAGHREEVIPDRAHFSEFPVQIEQWRGYRDTLEAKFIEALKFEDYVLANYQRGDGIVNFYAAYYASQRKGESAHSPRSCIPGGGWEIQDLRTLAVPEASFAGQPARANRVEIQKGQHRQLVYYWFQQRGRVITSEYEVKLRLLLDGIGMNRTDGALVRLTTPIGPGESWEAGDRRLTEFMKALSGRLEPYVPI